MQFEWVREGPAEACRDKCREWIAAVGRITADTPREFDAFSRTRDLRGATLVLDSPGGAVSGLGLGRSIRNLGIRTTVGKTGFLPPSEGQKRATLSPKAHCASMCAFVLLGGARRHVPAEARVLVHQIWPSTKRDDATAANYTAIDLVRVQRELGNLARYTMEMGADIQLFEIAMRIPPWEALRPLSNSDLIRLGIYNSDDAFEPDPSRPPATLGTVLGGSPAPASSTVAAAAEPVARAPAEAAAIPVAAAPSEPAVSSTQQWTIIERGGTREMVRRNPLTIEGDELGVFELRLSCGPGADSYSVVYAERRKLRPGEATTERLNGAILLLGRERSALTITASARNGIASDLISVGRGRLPKTAVNDFVEGKIKSVAIATRTSGNARSLIRVGNTGLAQAFSQISAGCGKLN